MKNKQTVVERIIAIVQASGLEVTNPICHQILSLIHEERFAAQAAVFASFKESSHYIRPEHTKDQS